MSIRGGSVRRGTLAAALAAMIAAACSSGAVAPAIGPTAAAELAMVEAASVETEATAVSPREPVSQPAIGGLPSNPPSLLSISRDSIRPIYEPRFVSASAAGLAADDLVMGVSIDGDSRAYPIGILTFREMVNDVVGGTPVLVSW